MQVISSILNAYLGRQALPLLAHTGLLCWQACRFAQAVSLLQETAAEQAPRRQLPLALALAVSAASSLVMMAALERVLTSELAAVCLLQAEFLSESWALLVLHLPQQAAQLLLALEGMQLAEWLLAQRPPAAVAGLSWSLRLGCRHLQQQHLLLSWQVQYLHCLPAALH